MSAVNDPYTLDSLSRLCTPCFSIPWSPAPPTWRIGWDGHRTTRVARRLMLSAPRCVTAASCRPVVTFPLSLLPRTAQQELRSGKKPLRKENSRIHQTAETQKLPRWTTAVSLILNQDFRDWYGGVEGYSLFNYGLFAMNIVVNIAVDVATLNIVVINPFPNLLKMYTSPALSRKKGELNLCRFHLEQQQVFVKLPRKPP